MAEEKIVMRIDEYDNKGHINLSVEGSPVYLLSNIVKLCREKYGGYMRVKISPPYKRRTTGKNSQNSKWYALVQKICEATGNDIEDVKDYLKEKAIRRGYPYRVNNLNGKIRPYSTTEVDTVQMSYLIEETIQFCIEYGINPDIEEVEEC